MGKKKTKKIRKVPSDSASGAMAEATSQPSKVPSGGGAGSSATCTFCLREGAKMYCTQCRAPYCSKDCQVHDWQRHKPLCRSTKSKKSDTSGNQSSPNLPSLPVRAQVMHEAAKMFGGHTIHLDSVGNIVEGMGEDAAQFTFTGFPENAFSQVLDNMKDQNGDEIQVVRKMLHAAEKEKDEVKAQLSSSKLELDYVKKESKRLEQKYNKEADKHTKTIAGLEKQLNEARRKLTSADSSMKNTRSGLENRLRDLESTNEKLSRELEEAKLQVISGNEREAKLNDTLADLIESNTKVLERESNSTASLQKQIEELKQKLEASEVRHQVELQLSRTEGNEQNSSNSNTNAKQEQLVQQYEQLSHNVEALQQQLQEKDSNFDNLMSLFQSLQQANIEQQEQLRRQQQELEQSKASIHQNFLPQFEQQQWGGLEGAFQKPLAQTPTNGTSPTTSGLFQYGNLQTPQTTGDQGWQLPGKPVGSGLSLPTFPDSPNQWDMASMGAALSSLDNPGQLGIRNDAETNNLSLNDNSLGSLNNNGNDMPDLSQFGMHSEGGVSDVARLGGVDLANMPSHHDMPSLSMAPGQTSAIGSGFHQDTSAPTSPYSSHQDVVPDELNDDVERVTTEQVEGTYNDVEEEMDNGDVASEHESDEVLCMICLEREPSVMMLPCCHRLCGECATGWRKRQRDCPICRKYVKEFCGEINEVFPDPEDGDVEDIEDARNASFATVERSTPPASAAAAAAPVDSFQVVNRKSRAGASNEADASSTTVESEGVVFSAQVLKAHVPYIPLPPNGVPYEGHPKWKTQICRHYDAKRCQNSRRTCPFAHGKQDLRSLGDPQALPPKTSPFYKFHMTKLKELIESSAAQVANGEGAVELGQPRHAHGDSSHPLWKTQLCKHFLAGRCTKLIQDCPFAHGKTDLRVLKSKPKPVELSRSTSDGSSRKKTELAEQNPRMARHASAGVSTSSKSSISFAQAAGGPTVPSSPGSHPSDNYSAEDYEDQKWDANRNSTHPLWKTQLCRHHQTNSCFRKSEECQFAHGKEDLRIVPKTFASLTLGDLISPGQQ